MTNQTQPESIETLKAILGAMSPSEVASFMAAIYKASGAA